MNNDRTRSRRKTPGPTTPCTLSGCDGVVGSNDRCDKCYATLARLRGMRPKELDDYERTSWLRLGRLAIVRKEREEQR